MEYSIAPHIIEAYRMPALFEVPDVENNVEGWGPLAIPDHLAGIPYAPFGKGDKVGKISDFTQAGKQYGKITITCERSCADVQGG